MVVSMVHSSGQVMFRGPGNSERLPRTRFREHLSGSLNRPVSNLPVVVLGSRPSDVSRSTGGPAFAGHTVAGVFSSATWWALGNSWSSGVRRKWMNPTIVRINIRAARMKQTIAPNRAICPNCQKA